MLKTYAEYSARPSPYEVQRGASDGQARVTLRDQIAQMESGESGGERWSATEYTLTMPWRAGLEADVAAATAAWLENFRAEAARVTASAIRAQRDKLLAATDQRVALDRLGLSVPDGGTFTAWLSFFRAMGTALTGGWASYRQALRDLPRQEGFPFAVTWPTPPAE